MLQRGKERGRQRGRGGLPSVTCGWGGGCSHLCSVPDNGRPGVPQFVSTGPFVIVDQEKVILAHDTHTDKDLTNSYLNDTGGRSEKIAF